MQIFIFGDSISYGFWDKKGGWVQRFREYLDKKALKLSRPETLNTKFYATVYNLSIPGDMGINLGSRIRKEFEDRYNPDEESIFLIAIGINDSHYDSQIKSYGSSLEDYIQNLKQILQFAKGYCQKIIFVGLTPVDEKRTNPIFWQTENFYKNSKIKKYDKALKKFCRSEKVGYIKIYKKLAGLDLVSLLEDGIHPNSKGHKIIFEEIKTYLLEKGII